MWRGRKRWNGRLSVEAFPFSVAVTPSPISPLGCTQPFSVIVSFFFLLSPGGRRAEQAGQAASDKVLQNVVGSRETDCSAQM